MRERTPQSVEEISIHDIFIYLCNPSTEYSHYTRRWKLTVIHIFRFHLEFWQKLDRILLRERDCFRLHAARFAAQNTHTHTHTHSNMHTLMYTQSFYITRPSGKMFPSLTFSLIVFLSVVFFIFFGQRAADIHLCLTPHLLLSLSFLCHTVFSLACPLCASHCYSHSLAHSASLSHTHTHTHTDTHISLHTLFALS